MSGRLSYVVFGAGNGGCAMAAELALLGREVALVDYSEFADRLASIQKPAAGRHIAHARSQRRAPVLERSERPSAEITPAVTVDRS